MRLLIEKSVEFAIPLFVFDGDLHKAYDMVKHRHWVAAHAKRGISQVLTAAWIRETRGGHVCVRLPGLPAASAVRRQRSMTQGDPTTPTNFNIFLDDPIEAFVAKCRTHGWGFPIDDVILDSTSVEDSPGQLVAKKRRIGVVHFSLCLQLLVIGNVIGYVAENARRMVFNLAAVRLPSISERLLLVQHSARRTASYYHFRRRLFGESATRDWLPRPRRPRLLRQQSCHGHRQMHCECMGRPFTGTADVLGTGFFHPDLNY